MGRWLRCLLLGSLVSVSLAGVANGAIIRVKPGGNDGNNGSSWELAKLTVQATITSAASGDEIWVAAGTYVERITLKEGIGLYGGFAGTETSRDQRDWHTNASILDGNQGGSVVTIPTGVTAATCIDGFTIRNGKAANGGGICCTGSPVISNNRITNNTADMNGGGLYANGGNATISSNMVQGNSALRSQGGGVYLHGGSLAKNVITDNVASYGGGISTFSTCTITNNTISNNIAGGGGGIYCLYDSPVLACNIIMGNVAGSGGGIYCTSGEPVITNNTIVHNSGSGGGGAIYSACSPSVRNNIICYNSSGIYRDSGWDWPTVSNNCVYNPDGSDYTGISAGTGDISIDPKLVSDRYGQLHIQPDSPCRDAGSDTVVGVGWIDMDGQTRIQGTHVDMGADESDGTSWTFAPTSIRVSPLGSDSNDGLTWSSAKRTIQAAVDAAMAVNGEVWVAAGTYNERIRVRPICHIYGGFDGSEDDRSERDWNTNVAIVDGQQTGTTVTIVCGNRDVTIDGITIRNGKAERGGGLLITGSPLLQNDTITGNTATQYGGGIYCDDSALLLLGSSVTGNNAADGGGVYCTGSAVLSNNRFTDNVSSSSGGAIYGGGSSEIAHNTFTGNKATSGGAIYCRSREAIHNNWIANNSASGGGGIECSQDFSGTVSNNTIIANRASSGGAVFCSQSYGKFIGNTLVSNSALSGGGFYVDWGGPTICNNIVALNSSGIAYRTDGGTGPELRNNCVYNPGGENYSGLAPGTTDISVDPGLVSARYGKVHIQPGSPCRDAGDDSFVSAGSVDMDDQPRIQNGHVDIGADESDGSTWPSSGSIVRVSSSGDDANDGSTWQSAKKTVQNAVNAASENGAEVWVSAGTYSENVKLVGWVYLYGGFAGNETSRSERDVAANKTVLDGHKAGSVVTVICGYKNAVVDGFTIRNGQAIGGGGICCDKSSPTIANNSITGNNGSYGGGGVYCRSSVVEVVNNLISGNTGSYGGGVNCSYGASSLHNNIIVDNQAKQGGGVCCGHDGSRISCNLISGNTASSGGGFYSAFFDGIRPSLLGNTLSGNSAADGGGMYCLWSGSAVSGNIISLNSSGIYDSGSATITLKNNCVYNPSGANYTGVSAGATDISVDPGFLAPWVGNYRLRPDSACVNAGDDASVAAGSVDLDGKARIVGAHVDMGCYEWDGIGNIVNGLGEAKAIPENCPIQITGKPITGAFDGSFYIEEPNRSQGLKIIWPDAVTPGDTATVTGPVVLDNGERAMQATTVATTPGNASNIPPWLFISGKYAGGGGYFWNCGGFACGQQGIFGSAGLNNVGLLVRVCGRFGYVDGSTFTVDDGSGTVLKCVASGGVSLNTDWRTVGVTGICSCEFVDGRLKPVLRVRSSDDIDVYSP